jgi:hypothetical protein
MSASIANRTTHAYPGTFSVPARGSADVGLELKKIAVAVGFVAFCCLAFLGAWYAALAFQNESYRAVVIFLAVIVVSNVTSKYFVWRVKRSYQNPSQKWLMGRLSAASLVGRSSP